MSVDQDLSHQDLELLLNCVSISYREDFEALPPHLKFKIWTQDDLFKEGEHGRIRIEYYEDDDSEVASLMSIFSKPPIRKSRKDGPLDESNQIIETQITGIKRNRQSKSYRKRIRWDQKFDNEGKNKYKTRIVELVNACCRPGDLEESVWLADPYFRIKHDQYTDDSKMGSLCSLVRYLTYTLIDIRRDIHEKARMRLDNYEGMTLHEIITTSNSYKDNSKVAVGFMRGSLGKVIQDKILATFNIDKETFKANHYKRQENYSENYFVVYRTAKQGESDVTECDLVRAVLNDFLHLPADEAPT
jgi:hypothetical protein